MHLVNSSRSDLIKQRNNNSISKNQVEIRIIVMQRKLEFYRKNKYIFLLCRSKLSYILLISNFNVSHQFIMMIQFKTIFKGMSYSLKLLREDICYVDQVGFFVCFISHFIILFVFKILYEKSSIFNFLLKWQSNQVKVLNKGKIFFCLIEIKL